ncbi:NYN domain-containing protein [Corynebacterium sp. 335C]
MLERTLVYVDTSYLLASFYNSWETGARAQLEIDLREVVRVLDDMISRQLGQPIQRQLWYDGIPESGPHRYQRSLRSIDGVQLRAGQLIEWGNRRIQKAVDTRLVTDMVIAGLRQQASDIVLVSGDADMLPGVTEVSNAGVRVHLYGFGWDSMSSALRHACDSTTVLDPREDFAEAMQINVLEGPLPPVVRGKPIGDAEPPEEDGATAVPDTRVTPPGSGESRDDGDRSGGDSPGTSGEGDQASAGAGDAGGAADSDDAGADGAAAGETGEAAAGVGRPDGSGDGASEGDGAGGAADGSDAGRADDGDAAAKDGGKRSGTADFGAPSPARVAAACARDRDREQERDRRDAEEAAPATPTARADDPRDAEIQVAAKAGRREVPAEAQTTAAEQAEQVGGLSSPARPDAGSDGAGDGHGDHGHDGGADHGDAPGAAAPKPAPRPSPSMMAPRRKLRSRYVPLPNEVWASAGFQTPFDVGQQYASWWYESAATEKQRDEAHLLSGGGLPTHIDRPLLQFACETLHEYTLTENQRVNLRDGFHAGIRSLLLNRRRENGGL